MPTPQHAAWRDHTDRELRRLRRQFIFLFIFAVAVSVALSVVIQINAQAGRDRIELDRYQACLARALDIQAYNAKIHPPGVIPEFPAPKCPADPRL